VRSDSGLINGYVMLCYVIPIFNGAKGVAMTTEFKEKYAKIAHI